MELFSHRFIIDALSRIWKIEIITPNLAKSLIHMHTYLQLNEHETEEYLIMENS